MDSLGIRMFDVWSPAILKVLLGGGAGDRPVCRVFADRGKGDMFVPFEDEVGMDFVTNDSDIVLSADFRIGTQLLFRPHTAHGVVGGAEDSRLYLVGFNFFFQIGKINFIMAVFKNKGLLMSFLLFCVMAA